MHPQNKEVLEKYTKLWDEIKYLIKTKKAEARNSYRNVSEKEKQAKREYQRQRYHMNDLNEKLKKYQRDYYDSKRIRK